MNVFYFPLFQQVALIHHELDWELVGLIGKTWFVEQLLLLVVEQLPLSSRGCRSTFEPNSFVQS